MGLTILITAFLTGLLVWWRASVLQRRQEIAVDFHVREENALRNQWHSSHDELQRTKKALLTEMEALQRWQAWFREPVQTGEWTETNRLELHHFLNKTDTGRNLVSVLKFKTLLACEQAVETHPHSEAACNRAKGRRGTLIDLINLSAIKPPEELENPDKEEEGADSLSERLAP